MSKFTELNLAPALLHAEHALGYTDKTPIQDFQRKVMGVIAKPATAGNGSPVDGS